MLDASPQLHAEFRPDRVLVRPRPGVERSLAALAPKARVLRAFPALGDVRVLAVPEGETVPSLIAKLNRSGLVRYAEPDYRLHLADLQPNDPKYADGTLWALQNTGQDGGLADADIDAPEGWEFQTSAANVVVAVIDTGVRYTHEDLAANMWVHPQDGSHGLNAMGGSNDPNDDSGHGSLVAGILGAVGNNGKGVVGVAWDIQIMACKFADDSGGFISDAIACIDYARTNGANLLNASWGTYEFSESLSNAVLAARQAGMIVVAAAGNDLLDTDLFPYYPAAFPLDNIVSVAATTRRDELHPFSNYGMTSVDLAAPGQDIVSAFYLSDQDYASDQGTSMAAPFVTGACALLRARYPQDSPQQIIARLLAGTDPLSALAGRCVSGGRLNLRKALAQPHPDAARLTVLAPTSEGSFRGRLSGQPGREYVIEATTNLMFWTPLATNVTGLDGAFLFVDVDSTNHWQRFYRGLSAP